MAAFTASIPFIKEVDAELACAPASFTPSTLSRQNSDSTGTPASSRSSSPPPASLVQCSFGSRPTAGQSVPLREVLYAARFHDMDGLDVCGSTLPPVTSETENVKMSTENCIRAPFAQKLATRAAAPEQFDHNKSAALFSNAPQLQLDSSSKVPFAQKRFDARKNMHEEPEIFDSVQSTNCTHLCPHQSTPLAPVARSNHGGSSPKEAASSFAENKLAAREYNVQEVEAVASIEVAEKPSTASQTRMEQKSASVPFTQKYYAAKMRCRPELSCDITSADDFSVSSCRTASKKPHDDKSGAVAKVSFAQQRFAIRMRDDAAMLF